MTTAHLTRPTWYTDEDEAVWDKVKSAFRRDLRRLSGDYGTIELDLDQSPNRSHLRRSTSYLEAYEPAYRFGYAASRHFGDYWNDDLESMLRDVWGDDLDWKQCRNAVKAAYRFGQNQLCDTHVFYDAM